MKYMQEGGFQRNPLMRLTLGLTLALLCVFWVSAWGMYFQRMTLWPSSVVDYYNGNEAEFRNPQSVATMTETLHVHMAMMSVVLLLLTHLAIFAPFTRRVKVWLIAGAFLSAVAEEGGGWLVRFVSPSLAVVKVVGMLGLQATMAVLMAVLGAFLLRGNRRSAERKKVAAPGVPALALAGAAPVHAPMASVGGATLVDLSLTGMRLELAVPLPVDSVHAFHLTVDGHTEKVDARVAACTAPGRGHPRTYVIGLEFNHISATMWEALTRELGPPAKVGE